MRKLRLSKARPGLLEKSGFKLSFNGQAVKGNSTSHFLSPATEAPVSFSLLVNRVLMFYLPSILLSPVAAQHTVGILDCCPMTLPQSEQCLKALPPVLTLWGDAAPAQPECVLAVL